MRHSRWQSRLQWVLLLVAAGPIVAMGATVKVAIRGMKFEPETVEVKSGDSVEWTNDDLVPHTATSEQKAFDSKAIEPGKSWRFKAKKAGTIPYQCSFHPTMKGTVVVK